MKKIFIMGFIFLSSLIPVVKPKDNIRGTLPPLVELKSVKSAVLMEVETNQVLYQFNAHEKRAPASMTKIMTMKLVLDALKNNQRPILFIHGTKDVVADIRSMEKLYENCKSPKFKLIVDGAGHMQSCFVDPCSYQNALLDFFRFCEST
jgi:pimeloyl-ACP methyl ester carboxylesterase